MKKRLVLQCSVLILCVSLTSCKKNSGAEPASTGGGSETSSGPSNPVVPPPSDQFASIFSDWDLSAIEEDDIEEFSNLSALNLGVNIVEQKVVSSGICSQAKEKSLEFSGTVNEGTIRFRNVAIFTPVDPADSCTSDKDSSKYFSYKSISETEMEFCYYGDDANLFPENLEGCIIAPVIIPPPVI